jgi:spermidine/putrescine-binding protein
MRVRILTALAVVLLLSAWVATAAAGKKQPFPASQQLCETTYGGTFSTRASSSFFRPFYKKQGVVWTCNSYGNGSTASAALSAACLSDGGQQAQAIDSGFATCWKNSAQ